MAEFKTNVMRMLDKEKVPYTPHTYDHGDGAIDGASVAAKMGQDPARVFKTLVTQGAGKSYFVFVVPVLAELDLKKAAKSVGEKSVLSRLQCPQAWIESPVFGSSHQNSHRPCTSADWKSRSALRRFQGYASGWKSMLVRC